MSKTRETPEQVFPYFDWQYEVACGNTKLGYAEWVEHKMKGVCPNCYESFITHNDDGSCVEDGE